MIRYTIVVVSLNAGEKLQETLNSIFTQNYSNYSVIIKDGESTDGSLSSLVESGFFCDKPVTIEVKKDKSIYDAMNQAVELIEHNGEDMHLVQFLNCGDTFYDEDVLSSVAEAIDGMHISNDRMYIFYGNQYDVLRGDVVSSKPGLTEFDMYRNIPCHQLCFYLADLFQKRDDGSEPYHIEYKVRGDYEHFLYSVYVKKATPVYINRIICNYEGGGYSETEENRIKSRAEHREITEQYMGKNAGKYRMILLISGARLRTWLAESPVFSGPYNMIKTAIYNKKRR